MDTSHEEVDRAIAEVAAATDALEQSTGDLEASFEKEAAGMNEDFAAIDADLTGMLSELKQENDQAEISLNQPVGEN